MGILVCGLNGSGKSTLGKALSERLSLPFIDIEDLYFPKTDQNYLYAAPRTKTEVQKLLLSRAQAEESFVFSAVKGDYGEEILPFYQYIVRIEVPKEIRMERVKNRSFEKFGDRMLPGGDLYEQEKSFLDMVRSRTEQDIENWLQTLSCPVLRVDGTKPVEENILRMMTWVASMGQRKEGT